MPTKHRCKICGKSFKASKALSQHMKSKHPFRYYAPRIGIPAGVILGIIVLLLVFPIQFPQSVTTMATISTHTSVATHTTSSETSTLPKAPDFTLTVIDELGVKNEYVKLSDFRGKPVFLEFTSPTCPHCAKMTPIVKKLYEKYGNKIVFLSVMVSDNEKTDELCSKFIGEHGVSWTHLIDRDLKVFKAYGVEGTPTYIIIDSEHRIVKKLIGEQSESMLDNVLKQVAHS